MEKVAFADYVVKDEVTQQNSFECAAWSETVQLEPGSHPVACKVTDGRVDDLVWFSIPGVITEDYFQSLCCGMSIGEAYDRSKNEGKSANWHGSFYCHSLAKDILKGEATSIRLRPGFEARSIDFIDYKGEPCRTYGIFQIERG